MTATFNANLLDAISRVRQLYGDTDITAAKIQDETISYYLGAGGLTELRAAAQLCRDLAAKYADRLNSTFDRELTEGGDLYKHYMELAGMLEKRAAGQGPATADAGFTGVFVGGVDVTTVAWTPADPFATPPFPPC